MDREILLNGNFKQKDDTRIPLVLTYHPALQGVSNILQKCANILLVDDENRKQFAGKFSFHLGGQKTLKTLLFALNCKLKIRSWCQKELLNAVVRDVKSALLFKRVTLSLMRMIRDVSRIFQGLTIAILQT